MVGKLAGKLEKRPMALPALPEMDGADIDVRYQRNNALISHGYVPSQKVIGDYLCRLGGPKYLLRRYVEPQ